MMNSYSELSTAGATLSSHDLLTLLRRDGLSFFKEHAKTLRQDDNLDAFPQLLRALFTTRSSERFSFTDYTKAMVIAEEIIGNKAGKAIRLAVPSLMGLKSFFELAAKEPSDADLDNDSATKSMLFILTLFSDEKGFARQTQLATMQAGLFGQSESNPEKIIPHSKLETFLVTLSQTLANHYLSDKAVQASLLDAAVKRDNYPVSKAILTIMQIDALDSELGLQSRGLTGSLVSRLENESFLNKYDDDNDNKATINVGQFQL